VAARTAIILISWRAAASHKYIKKRGGNGLNDPVATRATAKARRSSAQHDATPHRPCLDKISTARFHCHRLLRPAAIYTGRGYWLAAANIRLAYVSRFREKHWGPITLIETNVSCGKKWMWQICGKMKAMKIAYIFASGFFPLKSLHHRLGQQLNYWILPLFILQVRTRRVQRVRRAVWTFCVVSGERPAHAKATWAYLGHPLHWQCWN
jgi:hypothetical protein